MRKVAKGCAGAAVTTIRNCSSTGGLQLRWPGEARSSRGKGRREGQRGEGGLSPRVQRRLAAAQSAKAARTAVVGLGELVVALDE